ncbi:MAG: spore germination protein [Lachnospiraceae bacterium]|nr:spore germination protein [Lachnospiraceae bacterium]
MSIPLKLYPSLKKNIALFHQLLPIGKSFDIITRDITLGSTSCYFLAINGMCDLQTIQWLFADIEAIDFQAGAKQTSSLPQYVKDQFFYAQITFSSSPTEMLHNLLCGPCILLMDGYEQGLIIDTRKYPTRSIEEPDTERVIQGAKDGFTETLLTNCNLIRRRLRYPGLTFSLTQIGTFSNTDVAIAYLENQCDDKFLKTLQKQLKNINTSSLTMGIHSLQELLIKKSLLHPMPSAFLTARPDVACSYLAEGYILLMVDTSPFALVLPCHLFQFTQSPEDYYKSPLVGTYTRLVRLVCFFISLFLMPLFLLFCLQPELLPGFLQGMIPDTFQPTAIFVYVLFVELGLDLFKYASAHASNAYSGAFAIVGGLLLGDMAISLQWTNEEVIFYGAATLLSSLGIASVELADAVKIFRLFLILMTGFFAKWGFAIGLLLILISIITTPVFSTSHYLWPLYPLCPKALSRLIFRFPTDKVQPQPEDKHRC